jgi:hypothetical protein
MDIEEDSEDGTKEGLSTDFTIEGWPVRFDEARKALIDMCDTYIVNCLLAYNVNGKLIIITLMTTAILQRTARSCCSNAI